MRGGCCRPSASEGNPAHRARCAALPGLGTLSSQPAVAASGDANGRGLVACASRGVHWSTGSSHSSPSALQASAGQARAHCLARPCSWLWAPTWSTGSHDHSSSRMDLVFHSPSDVFRSNSPCREVGFLPSPADALVSGPRGAPQGPCSSCNPESPRPRRPSWFCLIA